MAAPTHVDAEPPPRRGRRRAHGGARGGVFFTARGAPRLPAELMAQVLAHVAGLARPPPPPPLYAGADEIEAAHEAIFAAAAAVQPYARACRRSDDDALWPALLDAFALPKLHFVWWVHDAAARFATPALVRAWAARLEDAAPAAASPPAALRARLRLLRPEPWDLEAETPALAWPSTPDVAEAACAALGLDDGALREVLRRAARAATADELAAAARAPALVLVHALLRRAAADNGAAADAVAARLLRARLDPALLAAALLVRALALALDPAPFPCRDAGLAAALPLARALALASPAHVLALLRPLDALGARLAAARPQLAARLALACAAVVVAARQAPARLEAAASEGDGAGGVACVQALARLAAAAAANRQAAAAGDAGHATTAGAAAAAIVEAWADLGAEQLG